MSSDLPNTTRCKQNGAYDGTYALHCRPQCLPRRTYITSSIYSRCTQTNHLNSYPRKDARLTQAVSSKAWQARFGEFLAKFSNVHELVRVPQDIDVTDPSHSRQTEHLLDRWENIGPRAMQEAAAGVALEPDKFLSVPLDWVALLSNQHRRRTSRTSPGTTTAIPLPPKTTHRDQPRPVSATRFSTSPPNSWSSELSLFKI